MNKILLVEDDPSIVSGVCELLLSEGFSVDHASGQTDALEALASTHYDLLLVDISLRDGNGFSVCSSARGIYGVPVIFLTASGDEGSTVAGLELGADDYIPKPFRPRELVSRIKNVLRRHGGEKNVIAVSDLILDVDRGTLERGGREIVLSALEYRILLYLFSNKGHILTREKLLEEIWDVAGDYVNDNTLTVYIKRIREKLGDDPTSPTIIKTVRGIGYRVD